MTLLSLFFMVQMHKCRLVFFNQIFMPVPENHPEELRQHIREGKVIFQYKPLDSTTSLQPVNPNLFILEPNGQQDASYLV